MGKSTPRSLRQYETIWLAIKKSPDDHCRIRINNPELADRIKKGVIKEKDKDLAFKLKNDAEKWRLEIIYNEDTKEMLFKLVTRLGIMEKII